MNSKAHNLTLKIKAICNKFAPGEFVIDHNNTHAGVTCLSIRRDRISPQRLIGADPIMDYSGGTMKASKNGLKHARVGLIRKRHLRSKSDRYIVPVHRGSVVLLSLTEKQIQSTVRPGYWKPHDPAMEERYVSDNNAIYECLQQLATLHSSEFLITVSKMDEPVNGDVPEYPMMLGFDLIIVDRMVNPGACQVIDQIAGPCKKRLANSLAVWTQAAASVDANDEALAYMWGDSLSEEYHFAKWMSSNWKEALENIRFAGFWLTDSNRCSLEYHHTWVSSSTIRLSNPAAGSDLNSASLSIISSVKNNLYSHSIDPRQVHLMEPEMFCDMYRTISKSGSVSERVEAQRRLESMKIAVARSSSFMNDALF